MERIRLEILVPMNLILDGLSQSILPGSIIDAPAQMKFSSDQTRRFDSIPSDELKARWMDKLSPTPAPEHPNVPGATSVLVKRPM